MIDNYRNSYACFYCQYFHFYYYNYFLQNYYQWPKVDDEYWPVQQTPQLQLLPDLFDIIPDPNAFLELNPEGIPNSFYNELYPELLDPKFFVPAP